MTKDQTRREISKMKPGILEYLEKETDKTTPEKGGACRCRANRGEWSYIVKVNKVSVSVEDNWGNEGPNFSRTVKFTDIKSMMSAAEVQEKREAGLIAENAYKSAFWLFDSLAPSSKQPEEIKPEKEIEAERENPA